MIFDLKTMFLLFVIFVSIQCAAFPDPVTSKVRNTTFTSEKKVKILFTGFYRYEKEKDNIFDLITKFGFVEDQNSSSTLEIILQKKDPKYKYPLLHKVQYLLTFLSGGIFPSHIRTEQTLTFRYSNFDTILLENEYAIGMDQWRGIPVVLLMITHWPNRIYKEQLLETTKLEFIK